MVRAPDDQDEDKPLDPAVEKVRRKLVRFVVVNLTILFIALIVVLGAVVYKSGILTGQLPEAAIPAGTLVTGQIRLPAGARIVSQALSGNRLSLHVDVAGAPSIFLYDTAEKRMVGRFDIAAD